MTTQTFGKKSIRFSWQNDGPAGYQTNYLKCSKQPSMERMVWKKLDDTTWDRKWDNKVEEKNSEKGEFIFP